MIKQRALYLLRQMLGPDADFRPGQWEAIEQVVVGRQRVMVVQRTGWGKSIVYFLATKLLREQGAGPTLLISPLLALMRNQLEMAQRIDVRAETINSENRATWDAVEEKLHRDECDLLLISPERLANPRFQELMSKAAGRVGLFVVDEAHCISDWGHDFRPDYRRIVRVLQTLPSGVPVLGTTATANDRVVADVERQLGPGLGTLRGPLMRSSFRLQNISLDSQAERLAWLALNLRKFPGTGIIYCLTVADTERVAGWLRHNGIEAEAYHAGRDLSKGREELEDILLGNQIKALVATVALGMGFDKPDLGFVIHFQRPGSVVAYYQQVGRAGRALDRAYGILLHGREDDEIQEYFFHSAFPPARAMKEVVDAIVRSDGISRDEILSQVNVSYKVAEQALKLLEIERAVSRDSKSGRYFRTLNAWQPDRERAERVTQLRRKELAQMQEYVTHPGCLMEYLARALDDPTAQPCGRCANCRGQGISSEVPATLVAQAVDFVRQQSIVVAPRKQWPSGLSTGGSKRIPATEQVMAGRVLCCYGDSGWGRLVQAGKYVDNHFSDDLVCAAADLIGNRWVAEPPPAWVTAIPSRRHPDLVRSFAQRLAAMLGLPFHAVLTCARLGPEQKQMENSSMQARNVRRNLDIKVSVLPSPVLLVDDIVDSGWTLAIGGWLLRTHGSGLVYPFALAKATARKV